MKIAVVGTGMIARLVVPHLADWGWEISAICASARSAKVAEEMTAELGGVPYSDYSEMLDEIEADAIYIALPNSMHFDFCQQALKRGKNVIVEKPMATNYSECVKLAELARSQGLFLYEAVTTIHQPNYAAIAELLPHIGAVRVVSLNYSQYSSRYDAFCQGEVPAVFDPAKAGGALMDLGVYNLQWLIGLFGEPAAVSYLPNIERGIDTSGVTTLDYGTFKAVSVAAKDCAAPCSCLIQGTDGFIIQTTAPNICGPVQLHLNDGTEKVYDANPKVQWESEFRSFAAGIASNDLQNCHRLLDQSLLVSKIQTRARLDAGIRFPTDQG